MARENIIQALHELFEAACVGLFQSLGCEITRILEPPYELGDVPLASIDAGSNDLELMLFLRVPLPILALTYPGQEEIVTVDEGRLEAWIPELANQLMGKLKNRLIPAGCNLTMGLPECYFGTGLGEILPSGYEHAMFYFDVDNEIFECCLSIDVVNAALRLDLSAPSEAAGAGEGELELF